MLVSNANINKHRLEVVFVYASWWILKALLSSLASKLRGTLGASHCLSSANPLHGSSHPFSLNFPHFSRLYHTDSGSGNDDCYPDRSPSPFRESYLCLTHCTDDWQLDTFGVKVAILGNVRGSRVWICADYGSSEKTIRLLIVSEVQSIPGMSVCPLTI